MVRVNILDIVIHLKWNGTKICCMTHFNTKESILLGKNAKNTKVIDDKQDFF